MIKYSDWCIKPFVMFQLAYEFVELKLVPAFPGEYTRGVMPVVLLCEWSQARNWALKHWPTLSLASFPFSLLEASRAGPPSVYLRDLICLGFELSLSFQF